MEWRSDPLFFGDKISAHSAYVMDQAFANLNTNRTFDKVNSSVLVLAAGNDKIVSKAKIEEFF